MRNHFAQTFYELAKTNDKLCLVVADISPAGSIEKFRQEFPDRFINTGVAEQVMIGMCAGMAQKRLRPFAYTIATFALYRPFEMVRDDLAYQHLPVTVIGIGGGVAGYSSLGGTHHAQEDIFIASSIPAMQVIVPCDPLEVIEATKHCVAQKTGPIYMRLGKAGEPIFTQDAVEKFQFGKLRYLKKGSKVCIISYGTIMSLAFDVYKTYQEKGISPSLISMHTLKPFDIEGILKVLKEYEDIVVIEEISPHGYVASKMKELAWENKATCNIYGFSLQDKFIHTYGKPHELLAAHGLSLENIKNTLGI